jgi:hypothetical protein
MSIPGLFPPTLPIDKESNESRNDEYDDANEK